MTNETPSTSIPEQKPHQFGARLQSAREAMGIDRKDAAAQLHLHEKVITMIESGLFDSHLPLTFIRGYIRSYSKLLEIPEQEVKDALNQIKPKQEDIEAEETHAHKLSSTSTKSVTFNNVFMQLFTCLIVITLIGLVAIWWHSHKAMDNQMTIVSGNGSPSIPIQPQDQPAPMNDDMIASAVDAGLTAATSPNIIETRSDQSAEKIDTAEVKAAVPTPMNPPPAADATDITTKPDTKAVKIQTALPQQNMFARYFYRVADEQVAQQIIYGNDNLRSLLNFILFLIIITFGLRYYHHPLSYISIDNGRTIHRSRYGRSRNRLRGMEHTRFKLNKPLSFIAVFAIVSVIGYSFYHRGSHTPIIAAKATTQPATAKNRPADNVQLDADLESLAPSSHLDAKILNAFRINAVQAIVNQLNDYITKASAVQFALTDPSTDLGQFKYKKKYRHRHRQVVQYYDQNADSYNDSEQPTSSY